MGIVNNDKTEFLITLFAFGFVLVTFRDVFRFLKKREEDKRNIREAKLEEIGEALDGLLNDMDEINSEVDILKERVSGCEHGTGRLESSLGMDYHYMDYMRINNIEQRLKVLENEKKEEATLDDEFKEIEKEIKNG